MSSFRTQGNNRGQPVPGYTLDQRTGVYYSGNTSPAQRRREAKEEERQRKANDKREKEGNQVTGLRGNPQGTHQHGYDMNNITPIRRQQEQNPTCCTIL